MIRVNLLWVLAVFTSDRYKHILQLHTALILKDFQPIMLKLSIRWLAYE